MYSTKGTEEKVFESKYIAPGIHVVKIMEIKGEEPDGFAPRLIFTFATADKKTADVNLYMSEAAQTRSMEKLLHIATKVVTRDAVDAVGGNSLAEFGNNLNGLLAGKKLRMKFIGNEIAGKDGKQNWFKADLGLPTFAEACEAGAEHPALSDEESKLTFDENNKWDMKRLPVSDVEPNTAPVGADMGESDDDPF
jgi:hypothetical protein